MARPAVTPRLVADVGGTNTRIALYDAVRGEFRALREFVNREYDSLEQVVAAWLAQLGETAPETACIAAAAPAAGDRLTMVNIGWSFSRRSLARRFGWRAVRWLNDFEANAHALPHLGAGDLATLQAGEQDNGSKLATVGPGTGLGGATLQWVGGIPLAGAAEPGHAGLSPGNDLELELFRHLLHEHPDVYAELLLSGPGLVRLYRTLARISGEPPAELEPAEVSARALAGSDRCCVQALETFCALLGSACGDFVLANGAWGGLYIAGGIARRFIPFLVDSEFLPRLQRKGAMRDLLARMPVHVITAPHPGLVGAANAPLEPL